VGTANTLDPVCARVFRNQRGRAIDPVPFLVATALSFLGTFSFVPVYCLTLGLSLPVTAGVSVAVFAGLAALSYHRLVWTARPEFRGEIPAERRLARLFYVALSVTAILVGLTLLLVSR